MLVIEIRTSVSRDVIPTLERKVAFYQQVSGREVARRILISPMVEEPAHKLAKRLGWEVYTSEEEVPLDQ